MVDAGSVSAAVGVGKLFADVFGLLSKRPDPEILAKVTQLHVEFQGVVQESAELREKVRSLREQLEAPAGMEFRKNVYWLGDDGPFCPSCLDGRRLRVRMATQHRQWHCPVCKHHQSTPERIAETERVVEEDRRRRSEARPRRPWIDLP
ncbi:MAG TPA: hypothetical protein VK714_03675 [Myxococcota bacterium]|nr:hypothetical protein [Myxococcota bacterium]